MLKSKILRANTQKKQAKSIFPELKIANKLTMLRFFDQNGSQARKFSENSNKKSTTRDYTESRKYIDENQVQIPVKNSVKVSKKRLATQYMLVQQITTNSYSSIKSNFNSNVIEFAADQYQGQRDYNQDRILLCMNTKILGKYYNIFGIFDGHGGSMASQFAKNHFVRLLQEQLSLTPLLDFLQNLRKCINRLQTKICDLAKSKNSIGGTCASILITCQNSYYIVHVGDSRILNIKMNKQTEQLQFNQMTRDHKPEDPSQRKRIQSVGGKVYRNKLTISSQNGENYGPYRVLPGKLSVSRSLGDYEAKKQPNGQAISWQPELIQGRIEENMLFLLFSDGAYQKFSNDQISSFFMKSKTVQQIQIKKSIQSLLINAIIKQTSDNVSLVAVAVKPVENIKN